MKSSECIEWCAKRAWCGPSTDRPCYPRSPRALVCVLVVQRVNLPGRGVEPHPENFVRRRAEATGGGTSTGEHEHRCSLPRGFDRTGSASAHAAGFRGYGTTSTGSASLSSACLLATPDRVCMPGHVRPVLVSEDRQRRSRRRRVRPGGRGRLRWASFGPRQASPCQAPRTAGCRQSDRPLLTARFLMTDGFDHPAVRTDAIGGRSDIVVANALPGSRKRCDRGRADRYAGQAPRRLKPAARS